MAKQHLHHFLIAISRFSNLNKEFKKSPDRVMTEAKLSAAEKKLVLGGDSKKIRAYLGDELPAATIKFKAED